MIQEEAIATLLNKNGLTLSTAESCTGGLIAHKITNISGSSAYFLRGVVAYSNQAKVDLLGVSEKTLEQFGAVSKETVKEMAEGMKQRSGTDFSIAVTGVAGPKGGSKEKPVGLVFISISSPTKTLWEENRFQGNRIEVKEQTAIRALDLLLASLADL